VTATSLLPALASLQAGEFLMGNDNGRPDERPAHRVLLAPFRAAVSPVSNADYARFVTATGAPPAPFLGDERFSAPGQPVVGVSWHEAVAYSDWLAGQTGTPFRLPTEAEREYAARGGADGRDWPWPGTDVSASPAFAALATLARPHEPTESCANGFGLGCMAENVHEWCLDWYDAEYYAHSPSEQPSGPSTGTRKASRGGAWRHSQKFTRVAARSAIDPSFHYSDYGFRVYASAD